MVKGEEKCYKRRYGIFLWNGRYKNREKNKLEIELAQNRELDCLLEEGNFMEPLDMTTKI